MNILKKYKYRLNNLDCANCANKIEERLKKENNLSDVVVNFSSLTLSFMSNDDIKIEDISSIVTKIELEVVVTKIDEEVNKRIIEKKLLQDMDKMTFNDNETRQEYIQDMYNYLDQLFTNYGYLLNKYLKYPSDMIILEFIKYFLRQGKAVLSTARRQPLGSIVAEATDMFVWNMPDPIDQYQNLGGTLANKIGASPIDVFGEIIYPRFLTVLGN